MPKTRFSAPWPIEVVGDNAGTNSENWRWPHNNVLNGDTRGKFFPRRIQRPCVKTIEEIARRAGHGKIWNRSCVAAKNKTTLRLLRRWYVKLGLTWRRIRFYAIIYKPRTKFLKTADLIIMQLVSMEVVSMEGTILGQRKTLDLIGANHITHAL